MPLHSLNASRLIFFCGRPSAEQFWRVAVRAVDCVGYIASFLVLLTFYMKEMVPLRAAALCSNVAFLVYGGLLHLAPIILLHDALIPINICRLVSALRANSIAFLPDNLRRLALHLSASKSFTEGPVLRSPTATPERPTAPIPRVAHRCVTIDVQRGGPPRAGRSVSRDIA
jgi:hypothetical protein